MRVVSRVKARIALLHEEPATAPAVTAVLADAGVNAFAIPMDCRSMSSAVDEAAARLGSVYALINNVLPIAALAPFQRQTPDLFSDAFARVQAAVSAMQAVVEYLREAGEGRIVNVGQRYGESVNEGLAAYNAAGWSLVGITRAAALDWGRYQIATNLLLPLADVAELRQARARRARIIDLMISQLPLRRVGDCVEDIGGATLFLVRDAANFINGEVLHADGGQHIAGPVLDPIRFVREQLVRWRQRPSLC